MIAGFFKGIGHLAIVIASMAFLTAVGVFVLGAYLISWPIMRKSPRNQKIEAVTNLMTACFTALRVFQDSLPAMIEEMNNESE